MGTLLSPDGFDGIPVNVLADASQMSGTGVTGMTLGQADNAGISGVRTFSNAGISEGCFKDLVENTLDIILMVGPDGCIRSISPSNRQLMGYKPEKIAGRSIFDFVHPDNFREVSGIFEQSIQKSGFTAHAECRLKHKDRSWHYAEIVAESIPEVQARQFIVVGIRDITRFKKTEEALQETSDLYFSLMENSPDPILVINPDTSIRHVNSALEKLTGFSRDQLINVKFPYPWCLDGSNMERSGPVDCSLRKRINGLEACFRKKDGKVFWAEINLLPVKTGGRTRYVISCWKDITEQKVLRDELNFYMSQITLVQEEEKKRLARELHDDTAQALALLALELDSLTNSRESVPDKIARKVEQMKKNVDQALEDVRRFSHELRPAILDQLGLLPALEFLVDEMNQKGRIKTRLVVSGKEHRFSGNIELALFRIVQEALSNARKHSGATRVTVSIKFSRDNIYIKVADNGKGFNVVDDSLSAVNRGRLGLTSIKERAKLIGAELNLDSAPGKGTLVSVKL